MLERSVGGQTKPMAAAKKILEIGSTYDSVIREIDSMLVATANQKEILLKSAEDRGLAQYRNLAELREKYREQFHKVRAYWEKLDAWRQHPSYAPYRTEIVDYMYLLRSLESQTAENVGLTTGAVKEAKSPS